MIYLNKFIRLFGGNNMALIKCPECGKEISNYAKECNQCGYPLSSNLEADDYIYICPKCAMIYSSDELNADKKCRFCNIKTIITKETMNDFINNMDNEDDYDIILSKKYGGNQFSECAYRHRLSLIKQENKNQSTHQHQSIQQQHITQVTCPYCKSTNTKKISAVSRAGSILGFGLFSKKLGKEWHCNNCGSDF